MLGGQLFHLSFSQHGKEMLLVALPAQLWVCQLYLVCLGVCIHNVVMCEGNVARWVCMCVRVCVARWVWVGGYVLNPVHNYDAIPYVTGWRMLRLEVQPCFILVLTLCIESQMLFCEQSFILLMCTFQLCSWCGVLFQCIPVPVTAAAWDYGADDDTASWISPQVSLLPRLCLSPCPRQLGLRFCLPSMCSSIRTVILSLLSFTLV